ncbi:SDR family oxidoreductase [Pikeienuella sp. HZG-20]|uniref:SDR family oxidoreductase n=1 Tax=Paludibacillus litoralis TaxID=3133267 RepID=UPI0030ED3272
MTKGRALVTGASAGIGAATVRALVADGWTVEMTARRADRLAALAEETGAAPHTIDAGDAAAMRALVEGAPFDLLVANAGKGGAMRGLAGADPAEIAEIVHLNVTATLQLIAAILPGMAARGRGHVITLGSVSGVYPTGPAVYGASKHAVRGLIRNLRLETLGQGIRFTDIQPGRVATEFYDVAVADPVARARITDTGVDVLAPEDVAEAIRWAAAQPAHVNVSALELSPIGQTYGGARFAER